MIEYLHCIRTNTVTLQETERFQNAIDSYADLIWGKCPDEVFAILFDIDVETQIVKSMLQSDTYEKDELYKVLNDISNLICDYLYKCHTDLMTADHMRYQVNQLFDSGNLAEYAFLGDSVTQIEQDGKKIPVYQSVWMNDDGERMLACVSILDKKEEVRSFQFRRDTPKPSSKLFTVYS